MLTPSIFNKKANEIKDILSLPYWKDSKYDNLLTPSIYMKNANQIKEIIEYLKKHNLEILIEPKVIYQNNLDYIKKTVEYIKNFNEPLIVDYKKSLIFNKKS